MSPHTNKEEENRDMLGRLQRSKWRCLAAISRRQNKMSMELMKDGRRENTLMAIFPSLH